MVDKAKTLKLVADCRGIRVPQGTPVELAAGTEVKLTQWLGGNATVNVGGNLVQIPASRTHVLGEEYRHRPPETDSGASLEDRLLDVLRTCYDPEIPVNIVDLGLVYDCKISQLVDGQTRVDIKMTLTAPGCGMGPVLAEDARQKLLALPEVDAAAVEIVFDPPWSREMMSEAARLELGLL